MSIKFSEIHRKTPVSEPLFKYSCMLEACEFTCLQHYMFSCGFCQIFQNIQFTEYLQTAASGVYVWSACCIYGLFNWVIYCLIHFDLSLFTSKNYDTNKKQSLAVKNANNLNTQDFQWHIFYKKLKRFKLISQ